MNYAFFMDTKSRKLSFLFLAVIFLAVNLLTLHDGHDWGDDFAQYIRHAQNLLEGQLYASRISLEPAIVSPPGFPWLLVPLLKIFGLNFLALKIWNIIFWIIFVIAMYLLFRLYLPDSESLLASAVLWTFPFFFAFKQSILTDIPFLAMAMAAVAAFEYYLRTPLATSRSRWLLTLSLGTMTGAFMLRWSGVLLFLSALIALVVVRRQRKEGWIILSVLGMAGLFQWWWGVSFLHHVKEAVFPLQDWPLIFKENIRDLFEKFCLLFFPFKMTWSDWIFTWIYPWTTWLGWALFFTLLGWVGVRIRRRTLSMADSFLVLGYLSVLFWPISGDCRYLLPLIGLLLLEILRFLKMIDERLAAGRYRIGQIFLALLLFCNVSALSVHFGYKNDLIGSQESYELFKWIQTSTQPQERFMFTKARALWLLTDRPSVAFTSSVDSRSLAQRIKDLRINYLIFFRRTKDTTPLQMYHPLIPLKDQTQPNIQMLPTNDDALFEEILRSGIPIEGVWQNNRYAVFKVQPSDSQSDASRSIQDRDCGFLRG